MDIWEIGNELNGEWAGEPAQIRAKVAAAFEVVEGEFAEQDLASAITLNFWPSPDCYSEGWEETGTFARSLSEDVRTGVDYVFLSFYETACSPRATPPVERFAQEFNDLRALFPQAKVGFGEIGAQGIADGVPEPTDAERSEIATRYIGMHAALSEAVGPAYVGGYFWWYYAQEAVPSSQPMWRVLEDLFNGY